MFFQNCLWVPGYLKISNFSYPVPENAQPYDDWTFPPCLYHTVADLEIGAIFNFRPFINIIYAKVYNYQK